MIFFQIPSGGDRNYGYIVGCEKTKLAALVDPSPDPGNCCKKVSELGLNVRWVINTHTHSDHTGGNSFFKHKKGAMIVTGDAFGPGDIRVEDDSTLQVGEITLSFIRTPGHTMDSICVLAEKELMTGDTLFVGKIGGTGSVESAQIEFESLKKLMELPRDTRVWPGHNYGLYPSSTIGKELEENPFILRLNDFHDFMWLKDNWAAYKKEHGIL